MKAHNFNAGPAILPRIAIENTAKAILELNGIGMSLTYNLDFIPSLAQIAIITNSGVFPRPAGVQLILTYL